jgi:hypothetical protein
MLLIAQYLRGKRNRRQAINMSLISQAWERVGLCKKKNVV